jgi:hypothetical protein
MRIRAFEDEKARIRRIPLDEGAKAGIDERPEVTALRHDAQRYEDRPARLIIFKVAMYSTEAHAEEGSHVEDKGGVRGGRRGLMYMGREGQREEIRKRKGKKQTEEEDCEEDDEEEDEEAAAAG